MPAKPRFTREEIVEAALALVSEEGIDRLTARALAKRLGSSPQPIFTVFDDMDELRGAVSSAAGRRLSMFVAQSASHTSPFKQAGMQLILFAMREPKLFQMLLMAESETPMSFDEMLSRNGDNPRTIVDGLSRAYDLAHDEAYALFQHIWVFTYGIAVLCATKMCTFSEEEISQKIEAVFQSMLMYVKAGRLNEQTAIPQHIN